MADDILLPDSLVCNSPRESFLKQDDDIERIFDGDNALHGFFASVSLSKFFDVTCHEVFPCFNFRK
jgi:hypothetical protein